MIIRYFTILLLLTQFLFAQKLPTKAPAKAGFNVSHLELADEVILQSIEDGTIPGAVLLVMRNNFVVYRKAYGMKQLLPSKEKMEINTVFDMASVTKPVATATSAMILLEQGMLRLLDPVSHFIPEFTPWVDDSTGHKQIVRLIHLFTHTSGLPAYAPVKELEDRYGSPAPDSLISYIANVHKDHAPGTYFRYSCLNFITLQRIIEQISGQSLKDFSQDHIFTPLHMAETEFQPRGTVQTECAPTEVLDDKPLKGIVHDPLARVMMGCISGNAGLFSTADDLSLFAAMMLNNGILDGTRILSPASVKKMTSVPPGYEEFGRGLGWDLHSAYSSNMGDLFSEQAYGHTGYTGTSIVIDPETKTVVILLTNRVHPDDKGSVVRLRSLVSNIVAGSIIN
jgi:CubicO group peptidase (beta-lactamase class C family)